jgi:hypothetical protein
MLPRGDLAAAAAPGPYQVLAPPARGQRLRLAEALQRLAAWRRSVVLLQVGCVCCSAHTRLP